MTFAELPYWVPPRGLAHYSRWNGWEYIELLDLSIVWRNWLHCIDEKGQGFTVDVTVAPLSIRRAYDAGAILDAMKENAEANMADAIATFVPNPNIKPYDKADFFYTKRFREKQAREAAREAAR